MMGKLLLISLIFSNLFSNNIYYKYGEKVELTPVPVKKLSQSLQNTKDINSSIKYYSDPYSNVVGVANTIIAKCTDQDECQRVITKYTNLRFENISKNIYLIYLNKQDEIFDISVKLYEEGCFLYVHPNFYKEKRLR